MKNGDTMYLGWGLTIVGLAFALQDLGVYTWWGLSFWPLVALTVGLSYVMNK